MLPGKELEARYEEETYESHTGYNPAITAGRE
jgi:hypothetical protein